MVKTESKQMSSPSRSPSSSPPPSSSCSKKKFKGVRMRTWGSWVSEIRAPNQKTRIWLGSYSTAEAAARAYDAALLCLKGSSAANLNFPISDSSPYIPQHDAVLSPKSIQRVAAAAANSYITNIANNTTSPSPSPSRSSYSSSSSDDEVALTQSLGPHNDGAICNMVDQSWYNLEGPLDHEILCPIDQMYNVASFDSLAVMDDFEEEAYTIPLWSFC